MGVICHVCGGKFPGAGPGPKWDHDTDKCKDKRIAELEAGIRAALNMVDGDGLPPNWDALRKLVS